MLTNGSATTKPAVKNRREQRFIALAQYFTRACARGLARAENLLKHKPLNKNRNDVAMLI